MVKLIMSGTVYMYIIICLVIFKNELGQLCKSGKVSYLELKTKKFPH